MRAIQFGNGQAGPLRRRKHLRTFRHRKPTRKDFSTFRQQLQFAASRPRLTFAHPEFRLLKIDVSALQIVDFLRPVPLKQD
jgi:hypothetical protein